MRFLRVAAVHYAPSKQMPYQQNPALASLSYDEQLKTLFSYFFNYGNSLTSHLNTLGYTASEILQDVEPLQKKWAEENGCSFSEANWETEILIHQIQHLRPEILYVHNLPLLLLKRRKELFPFVKTLILFRGYPELNRTLFEILSCADILLVGSPILEMICKKNNLKSHLFYHYFDERILSHITSTPTYPFTFLGTSGYGYGWNHQPRYHYLLQLLKAPPIDCWLEEKQLNALHWKETVKRGLESIFSLLPETSLKWCNESQTLPSSMRKLAFNSWARKASLSGVPSTPLRTLFPHRCHHPVFGLEMCQILANSQVTFNKHTFAAGKTVDNIRLFEATGVGTCLLTDWGSNLSSLFEKDQEVVTYSSLEECKEKIKYLSENEAVRKNIAANGQKRTLRDHTSRQRAEQLHELIQDI